MALFYMAEYKRGDVVKVWSLQSFDEGGFIDGREGVVKQDQNGGKSVIVAVERNIGGVMKLDPSYEVYAQQLELVHSPSRAVTGIGDVIEWLKSM